MRPIWEQKGVESAAQKHSMGRTPELELDIDQWIDETQIRTAQIVIGSCAVRTVVYVAEKLKCYFPKRT